MKVPIYTRETLKTDKLPWVEIDDYEFIVLNRNMAIPRTTAAAAPVGHTTVWGKPKTKVLESSREFVPTSPKERLVVAFGEVSVETEAGRFTLKRRDWIEVPASGARVYNYGTTQAELIRVSGNWRSVIRQEICLFTDEFPCEVHYHDGDEYWFVFRGHFSLDYNGGNYAMKPGMMLAAGKGFEHGAPKPGEHFQAVVMGTTLEDGERDGHLISEVHGEPTPGREVPADAFEFGRV